MRGLLSFSESEVAGSFRLLEGDGEGERDKGGEMGSSGGSGAERVPRIWRHRLILSRRRQVVVKDRPGDSALADLL